MSGLTFDTGALIALERGDRRMISLTDAAFHLGVGITVPAPVVVEWWRGQRGPSAHLLDAFFVEPLDERLARVAGEALATVRSGPSVADAVVMASAARRGDRVYSSDLDDLQQLQAAFPAVRLFGV